MIYKVVDASDTLHQFPKLTGKNIEIKDGINKRALGYLEEFIRSAFERPLVAEKFFSSFPTSRQEQIFWGTIRLGENLFKTTSERRMEDLNALVISYWRGAGFEPARVLDLGASSGITSLEWLEAMQVAGFHPSVVGTDIAIKAMIIRTLPFHRILVRNTQSMEPLQHSLFGWALKPYIDGVRSLISSPIAIMLYKLVRTCRFPIVVERYVNLVSPRCTTHSELLFIEDDLFDAQSKARLGKFNVIRAANLLSPHFFSREKLKLGLRNIKDMLIGPGSFLIVNRTLSDGSNHGTMFRLEPGAEFRPVVTIGKGSELTDMVLSA